MNAKDKLLKLIPFVLAFAWLLTPDPAISADYTEVQFFRPNYISVDLVRNQPFADSQEQFGTGKNSAFVGFRHILRDRWLMGVHSGFKKFRIKESSDELSMFTILQETQMMYRLSHPIYLSVGPKLMFFLPTKGNKIPPEREKNYNREIGIAISGSIHFAISPNVFVSLRLDRWRGVNTEIFQGTESAVGINVALPPF